jgi:metal-responsive CopG/Arc/MetJ family transcriptional regulator
METIHVVLDNQLLRATDRAARRLKVNRSALVRQALREHLLKLETLALEERERAGYAKFPANAAEAGLWETVAVWPPE